MQTECERFWVEPKSHYWFNLRKTCDITASEAGLIINQHYKSVGRYLKEYHGYAEKEVDAVTQVFMQQGVDFENEFYPIFKEAIEKKNKSVVVVRDQFFKSKIGNFYFGASPDAIIFADPGRTIPIEFKFRNTPWLQNEAIPAKHFLQLYTQMMCAGSQIGFLIQSHQVEGRLLHKVNTYERTSEMDEKYLGLAKAFIELRQSKKIPLRTSKIDIENLQGSCRSGLASELYTDSINSLVLHILNKTKF
jgi:hypothetical protein